MEFETLSEEQKIEKLKEFETELKTKGDLLNSQKLKLEEFENLKKQKDLEIEKLKESNMRYFERITFQKNNIEIKETPTEKSTTINDIIKNF